MVKLGAALLPQIKAQYEAACAASEQHPAFSPEFHEYVHEYLREGVWMCEYAGYVWAEMYWQQLLLIASGSAVISPPKQGGPRLPFP